MAAEMDRMGARVEVAPRTETAAAPTGADRPTYEQLLEVVRPLMIAPRRSCIYEGVKRAIDLIVGTATLVAAAPLIALIAVAIRLDSRGPALYRQQRIGRNGELFEFVKFRTMRVDARSRFPELYRYDYDTAELDTFYFKYPHDPRCTRVGRWIRRTSLDELPNLLNVVRGDISLVGPRPEIPEMVGHYRPHQLCKFGVKPGLTGLAQVSGRNILRWQETNERDVEYVYGRSLAMDLDILVRTLTAVVLMVGAL